MKLRELATKFKSRVSKSLKNNLNSIADDMVDGMTQKEWQEKLDSKEWEPT